MRTSAIIQKAALVLFLWTIISLVLVSIPESSQRLTLSPLRFTGEHSASYPRPLRETYCYSWERPNELTFWTEMPSSYSMCDVPSRKLESFGWTRLEPVNEARVVLYIQPLNPSLASARVSIMKTPREISPEFLFFAPPEAAMVFTRAYYYGTESFLNLQTAVFGVDYACPGQVINHVPGASAFCRKDLLQYYLRDYKRRYQEQGLGHCYAQSITPKSYILAETEDCNQFVADLKTALTKYTKETMPIEWITKNARHHKGYGIVLVDYKEAQDFVTLYTEQGATCDRPLASHKNLIAQKYINDPALIEGRKFDFRVFAMIANVDPFVVMWAPENGHTRVSDTVFNKTSSDFTTHITANVDRSNKETDEFLKAHRFNLRELALYFAKEVGDPEKWLDEVAFPQVKEILVHMFRAAQQNLLVKRTGLIEFYGVDFIMDEPLERIYLLEANRRPDVEEKNPNLQYREDQLLQDVSYIARHLVETGVTTFDPSEIYPYMKAFRPLIDETLKDPYFGVLEPECRQPFTDFNENLGTDPMIDPLLIYLKEFN